MCLRNCFIKGVIISFKFTRFWRDDATNTLFNLICVNSSRCTSFSNLLVIGFLEMGVSIVMSILTWIPLEKAELTTLICHFERSGIRNTNFKMRNTDLQFRSPATARGKIRRRRKIIAKRYAFHANAITWKIDNNFSIFFISFRSYVLPYICSIYI